MQLRRIEVRAFRKLRHAVVEGIGDGLSVIVGDNEAGKSTLLAALRAVLFERHRVGGEVAAAMLPHGQSGRPEITIDFTLRGEPFRLRKAFVQKPEAELVGPGGTIVGDAVEERMAELLGFKPSARGSKPDEHQGIYGLLWVDQGLAHQKLNVGAGQDALSSALESEVGMVFGGERGRLLFASATVRRDAFWDKRDKPRGAFRQMQEQVVTLETLRAELDTRLRSYDEQVTALAAKTEILARHRRDDRLNRAVRDVEMARAATRQVEQLDAALRDLRGAAQRAMVERDAAAERRRTRQAMIDRTTATATAAADATQKASEAIGLHDSTAATARTADTRRDTARAHRIAIEDRLGALDLFAAAQKTRDDLARAAKALTAAEAVADKRREAMAVVAGIATTKAMLAELDALCAARDQAAARLAAASVQITVEAATEGLTVDGEPHRSSEPLLLARDAVLDLPGFGRLRIRPGGGVAPLVHAAGETEARVAATLARLGHATRSAVAEALARRSEAEAEATTQDRLFAHLAPKGLEPLRQAVATLRGAAHDGMTPATPPETETDRPALLVLRDAARLAEADAESEMARSGAERESSDRSLAVLQDRAAAARRDQADAGEALTAARAAIADDRLDAALADAERATAFTAQAEASAAAALAAADPETAALVLRRAEHAEKAIRGDIEAVTQAKRDLEIELRALGREGVGEQLAEVDGKLATARRQLAAMGLEGRASRLLHATLATAQRETKDRWLGPIRDRVAPYLRLIQPDAEIVLNETTFSIAHLLRDGVPEPFDTLSIGAKEQVAVITRLALADILRASGRPAAIILDDPLVNSDETRLDRMHLVLQKAAETLQILVLTCRERDFVGLGAPIHRV